MQRGWEGGCVSYNHRETKGDASVVRKHFLLLTIATLAFAPATLAKTASVPKAQSRLEKRVQRKHTSVK